MDNHQDDNLIPALGIPIMWENLNGVISEVTPTNPYRREAVRRFFQVNPNGDPKGQKVNYTHDFDRARRLFQEELGLGCVSLNKRKPERLWSEFLLTTLII